MTVGPLEPMPSLRTCTVISMPRLSASCIIGRARRGTFLPTFSVVSFLPPSRLAGKYFGCRSEMWRKPLAPSPKSTNAAWMAGSTFTTRAL